MMFSRHVSERIPQGAPIRRPQPPRLLGDGQLRLG
jgi:hypothetical protein